MAPNHPTTNMYRRRGATVVGAMVTILVTVVGKEAMGMILVTVVGVEVMGMILVTVVGKEAMVTILAMAVVIVVHKPY